MSNLMLTKKNNRNGISKRFSRRRSKLSKLSRQIIRGGGKSLIKHVPCGNEFKSVFKTSGKKGDIVIDIPLKYLITSDHIYTNGVYNLSSDKLDTLSETGRILVYLLIIKENHNTSSMHSFYKQYMDIFPKSFKHLPRNWDAEQINTQSAIFQSMVADNKLTRSFNYDVIQRTFSDLNCVSNLGRTKFNKLYDSIATRVFRASVNGKSVLILAPIADMLNHSSDPDLSWTYNQDTMSFQCVSTKDYEANNDCTESYGNTKSDMQLLISYGFEN